jgi:hypothetical protein
VEDAAADDADGGAAGDARRVTQMMGLRRREE